MGEVKTAPVEANLVDDVDADDVSPGAFQFYRAGERFPSGLIYSCPCGCGTQGALAFRPAPSPSWEWDGNREKPTLQPSVHHVGHWHGYLTAGVWLSC